MCHHPLVLAAIVAGDRLFQVVVDDVARIQVAQCIGRQFQKLVEVRVFGEVTFGAPGRHLRIGMEILDVTLANVFG